MSLPEGVASATAGDRLARRVDPPPEVVSAWRPIETAPSDLCVLLYIPNLHETNPERVEAAVYHDSRAGSRHAWATHWMPLPPFPDAAKRIIALGVRGAEAPSYPYPGLLAQALLVEGWLREVGKVPDAIVREFTRVLREAQASPPGGVAVAAEAIPCGRPAKGLCQRGPECRCERASGLKVAGDGQPCPNTHDPHCGWPDCLCRTTADQPKGGA